MLSFFMTLLVYGFLIEKLTHVHAECISKWNLLTRMIAFIMH